MERPVWHNRAEDGVHLYSVVLRVGQEKTAVLVLTSAPVVAAKDMAARALPNATVLGVQQIPQPLLSPRMDEIEQVLQMASMVQSQSEHALTLYRISLTSGPQSNLVCLVWSTYSAQQACDFARRCFPGNRVHGIQAVPNPIIVGDTNVADKALVDG